MRRTNETTNTNALELNFNNALTSKALIGLTNKKVNNMYNAINNLEQTTAINQNEIKSIVDNIGCLDWSKVEDKVAMLFHAGYSDAGNKIGIFTNVNAMLQDMFVYCSLEDKRTNLVKCIAGACSQSISGTKYVDINGKSPLFYAVPTQDALGYNTCAVMVHKRHADKFMMLLANIDINAMTDEDFNVLANDLSFLSRTQELAIDVAKDKTIEIVPTDEWLNAGIKPYMYHLNLDKKTGKLRSKNNLNEILRTIKDGNTAPEFLLESALTEEDLEKIEHQVVTSSCLTKNAIANAYVEFMNTNMLPILNNSTLTDQVKSIAIFGNNNNEVVKAIVNVLSYYREISYNIVYSEDKNLRAAQKEQLKTYANAARNTIYRIGRTLGLDDISIAKLTWAADMYKGQVCNPVNEVGTFKEIMPSEFLFLYADDAITVEEETMYFVEGITEELVLDGIEIELDFVNGEALDECGSLIASCSYKFNGNAILEFKEEIGKFIAVKRSTVTIDEVGNELLLGLTKYVDLSGELTYHPTTPNNTNVLTKLNEAGSISPVANNESKMLNTLYRLAFINNNLACKLVENNAIAMINNYETVNKYNLRGTLNTVNSYNVLDKNTNQIKTIVAIVTVK